MKLQEELNKIEIPENYNAMEKLAQLALFWPAVVMILKFIKIFTGSKADEKIDMIIEWGKENLTL